MQKRLLKTSVILFLFTIGIAEVRPEEHYSIVVNAANPILTMSRQDLANIFLKKVRKWQNNDPIDPVDQSGYTAIRENITNDIFGRRVSAIKAYWQKQIFTGRDVPPPEKINDLEVLRYIEERSGAIGYISIATSIEGFHVKVIKVVDDE